MNTQQERYFNRRPFVTAALGMMAGVLLGRLLPGPSGYIISGACIALSFLFARSRVKWLPLFLAFAAVGVFRLELAYPRLPQPKEQCVLSGIVVQAVKQGQSVRVTLSQAATDGTRIDGSVLLTVPRYNGPPFKYGQQLTTRASLTLPQGARNEGGMDYRFYCFSQGIVCTAVAKSPVSAVDAPPGIYGWLLQLRDNSTQLLIRLMGRENGALAAGMLHGAIEDISDQTLNDFRGAGIAHLLSVSGLHVSLLAAALLFLLRRVHPVPQFIFICSALFFYCALCAFAPPTLRAALMTICLLLSKILHRRNDPLSALSFSFLILLLIPPFTLFSIGFQLSYTAVLGILLLYPTLSKAMLRIPRQLGEPLALSVSASLATLPVSAAVFQSTSLLSIPANILVVPLCALSMLPSGIALFLYPISSALAGFSASFSGVAIALMRAVAQAAASPGMLRLPPAPLGAGILFFVFLLFCSPYFLGGRGSRRLLCTISAALCLLLWLMPLFLHPKEYVTVLDVPSGYAYHFHTEKQDIIVGTPDALKSTAVEGYRSANVIYHASMQEAGTGAEGTSVAWNGTFFSVFPGGVQIGGTRYTTAANGQMRFYEKDDSLMMQPYARDARYAILLNDP